MNVREAMLAITLSVFFHACAAPVVRDTPPEVAAPPHTIVSFRDSLKDGSEGPSMVWIPAGKFTLGDMQGRGLDSEVPVRTVTIAESFAIGTHEITFAEYDRFCDATSRAKPNDWSWGRGQQPVMLVDWFDATAYTLWLSEQTGKHYRLPTEAEWEYAARGGTRTDYWWGNNFEPDRASCYNCGVASAAWRALPVGLFTPNPFGLFDTVGNLWEWTASRWSPKFNGAEQRAVDARDVTAVADYVNGIQLSMRGGSWNLHPNDSRVSSRYFGPPQSRTINLGFRVARSK